MANICSRRSGRLRRRQSGSDRSSLEFAAVPEAHLLGLVGGQRPRGRP